MGHRLLIHAAPIIYVLDSPCRLDLKTPPRQVSLRINYTFYFCLPPTFLSSPQKPHHISQCLLSHKEKARLGAAIPTAGGVVTPVAHSPQLLPPSAQIQGPQNTTTANHMSSMPNVTGTSLPTPQYTPGLPWTHMHRPSLRKRAYRWGEKRTWRGTMSMTATYHHYPATAMRSQSRTFAPQPPRISPSSSPAGIACP